MSKHNDIVKLQILNLISPKEIKNKLDLITTGKEDAKRILSLALSEHIKRISYGLAIKKTNVLLLGATGCGKTHIITAMKKVLDDLNVIHLTLDAQKFSERNFANMLVEAADEKIPFAERSVVIIENLDRITLNAKTSKKSEYKNSIQNNLAQIIEGKEIKSNKGIINTSHILFIATGTFDIVDEKISERKDKKLYEILNVEDLKEFGLNNFLMRKFQKVIAMPRLSKADIVEILKQTDKNPVATYVKTLEAEGIKFVIEEDALDEIAERSIKNGIGVSGVYITLTSLLTEFYFEIEDLSKVDSCIITKETLENSKVKIIYK